MLKKDWRYTKENHTGGYDGSFKTYEVISPNGNIYKLHNSCNKYPHFYMETDRSGYYDKSVGETFNEAMQTLYQLEEDRVFKPVKEDHKEQIYIHSFHEKKGYSVEKMDMTTPFYQSLELFKVYPLERANGYQVYSYGSEKDFDKAKNMLQTVMNEEYRNRIVKQINDWQSCLNEFDNKIHEMLQNTYQTKEQEDDYDIER